MAHQTVEMIRTGEQRLYGLWKKSNDKTAAKDIDALSAAYRTAAGAQGNEVLPFFVLSKNYNEETRDFELFIGSVAEKDGLEALTLPAGLYAKMTVRPRLKFLWGPAIGAAKQYFYSKWLPASPYQALNMEYEYHTEKSTGRKPEIEMRFAVADPSINRRTTNGI